MKLMIKFSCCFALGFFALGAAAASAAVIATEDFTYADGPLAGQNGGVGFAGAWTGSSNVASNQADVSGSNSFRDLAATLGSHGSEVWGSVDILHPAADTFGGLSLFAPTAGGPGNRTERLLIGDGFNQDVWGISAPGHSIFNSASALDDTIKTGVFQIVFNPAGDDTVNLWVGADATSPVDVSGVPDASGNFELEDTNAIRLSHGAGGSTIDNLILGMSAADVGAIVPEPSTCVLLGLASLVAITRRRVAMA